MTTAQVLSGVGLILVLAVGSQLLGMSTGAALMTGAILVVSGPTEAPLLRFIRPTERLRRVLAWEGSLIDPVGGILGRWSTRPWRQASIGA